MPVTVKVKNFQSIKDAEVVIDGATALTGTNNTGKSSLFRAIRGVFQNTKGTKFVRYGADKCSVELVFDDGRSVRWEKGDKIKPTYILDGDEDHPIHPGQSVPDEVKALGVRTIHAGGREIWPQMAQQLKDQVFLLDEPGSVLAEAVANVDRVGRLNRSLKASEKDRRRAASELKVRLSDRDKIESELDRYKGLDDVAEKVEGIEKLSEKAAKVERAHRGLTGMRDRLQRARGVVSDLKGIEDVEVPGVGEGPEIFKELGVHQVLRFRYKEARGRVSRLEGVDEIDTDIDANSAERVLKKLACLRALRDRFSDAGDHLEGTEGKLLGKKQGLEDAEGEVSEILGDMGECPVCGTVTEGLEHDHAHMA